MRRFAVTITLLTIVGHAVLGFEQSYAQPFVAVAAAYATQFMLETIEAWAQRRRPRYAGGIGKAIYFLLSAHISALAIAMLLYYNDRLWIVAFASAVSIASKWLLQAPVKGQWRHFFNPSNFGVATTLLLFPSVGLLMPWQFSTNLPSYLDILLPLGIFALGTWLHFGFAKRVPLMVAWVVTFVLQALFRSLIFDNSLLASLSPITGPAFVIFTFYMAPDPVTTPERPLSQIAFGAAVAVAYGILMSLHIVYGLFFALTVVCAGRGIGLYLMALIRPRSEEAVQH